MCIQFWKKLDRHTILFVYCKLYYVWKYPKVNLTLIMSINEAVQFFKARRILKMFGASLGHDGSDHQTSVSVKNWQI